MFTRSVLCTFALCSAVHAEPVSIFQAAVDYMAETDDWQWYARLSGEPETVSFNAIGDHRLHFANNRIGYLAADLWNEGIALVFVSSNWDCSNELRDGFCLETDPHDVYVPFTFTPSGDDVEFRMSITRDEVPFAIDQTWTFFWRFDDRQLERGVANRALIPEPSALALAAAALLAIGLVHRRGRHRAKHPGPSQAR